MLRDKEQTKSTKLADRHTIPWGLSIFFLPHIFFLPSPSPLSLLPTLVIRSFTIPLLHLPCISLSLTLVGHSNILPTSTFSYSVLCAFSTLGQIALVVLDRLVPNKRWRAALSAQSNYLPFSSFSYPINTQRTSRSR